MDDRIGNGLETEVPQAQPGGFPDRESDFSQLYRRFMDFSKSSSHAYHGRNETFLFAVSFTGGLDDIPSMELSLDLIIRYPPGGRFHRRQYRKAPDSRPSLDACSAKLFSDKEFITKLCE